MKLPRWLLFSSAAFLILFWVSCVLIPLGALFLFSGKGLFQGGFIDSATFSVFGFSFFQAILSTVLSGGIGLFLGLWAGKVVRRKNSGWIAFLFSVPFGVPTQVVALTWVLWLGRSGILARFGFKLEWLYSLKAVILAHVFLNAPFVALSVFHARRGVLSEQVDGFRALGAGRISAFFWAVWPRIRGAFWSALAQVMTFCSMSFALILILGGGPPVQTLETELFQRIRYGGLDLSGAVGCALLELLLTFIPWAAVLWIQRGFPVLPSSLSFEEDGKGRGRGRRAGIANGSLFAIALFFACPYFLIFNRHTFGLFWNPVYREQIWAPLILSLKLAISSGILVVLSAVAAILVLYASQGRKALTRAIEIALVLPGGISILVLGLGIWIAYQPWFDPFEGSLAAMVALQLTLFFPMAFRLLYPVSQGIQVDELEGALSLGLSGFRAFYGIEWPRWKGPLLSTFALVASASLGEVGAVSLFYNEDRVSLSLLVTRWTYQYHFDEAQGVAGFLLLLSVTLMILCYRNPFSSKSDRNPTHV